MAHLLQAYLPVVKVEKGRYQIGIDMKAVEVKAKTPLVKVGGGWVPLKAFFKDYSR